MLRNKFLLLPFLIFFIALSIDRLLMIESIQTYFTKTVSEINFFHKPYLLNELEEYLKKTDRKKVLVYFGNSRALLFDNQYIDSKYPDWVLFNFSVPGGSPDFYLYYLEQFLERDIKPDFVLMDASIEMFNLSSVIKVDESLLNGLDVFFVLKHHQNYSRSEVSNFLAKKLFKTYQYRPKLNTIRQRIKNNFEVLNAYRLWRKDIFDRLIKERGSASSNFYQNPINSDEEILKFARGDFQAHLTPFTYSSGMENFIREDLKKVNQLRIPAALIMVRVSKAYFGLMTNEKTASLDGEKYPPYDIFLSRFSNLVNDYKVPLWNMNTDLDYQCDLFTDSSHMSSECFPQYTDFIFQKISRVLGNKNL
jgi:hypothetical protein